MLISGVDDAAHALIRAVRIRCILLPDASPALDLRWAVLARRGPRGEGSGLFSRVPGLNFHLVEKAVLKTARQLG